MHRESEIEEESQREQREGKAYTFRFLGGDIEIVGGSSTYGQECDGDANHLRPVRL